MEDEEKSKNAQSSATENEDNDAENFVAAHIPSQSAVSAMLYEAEEMSCKCYIPIAASSLRRAKRESVSELSPCQGGKRANLLYASLKDMQVFVCTSANFFRSLPCPVSQ